ncbi:MAG: YciI family protein [Bacteroidales bacterium]|jgi:uncharacterized protein YciI|nr:YciI family protein [Bacteroidales bacterium]
MKKLNLILLIIVFFFSCNSENSEVVIHESNDDVAYDSLLVKKYGADQYGMRKYVIAFLKRGPNRGQDSLEAAQLQKAHLENINQLAEEGKLVLAGPFLDDGDLRGIYIFNVRTIEEAQKLTETDPAIQKGSLIMELHSWYGSAAVMAIPELHKKLELINVAE